MSLVANGVNLKTAYNFVVQEISNRQVFTKNDITIPSIDNIDSIVLDFGYELKNFTIKGYVYGVSQSDARKKKDALINFLSAGTIELTFPDTGRSVLAKLDGEPFSIELFGPRLNPVAYSITLSFKPLYPYAYKHNEYFTESGAYLYPLKLEAPLSAEQFDFVFEPYTIVNLLGSYGSFSTDSDGDGLADGWQTNTQVKQINNGVQFLSDTITSPATKHIYTSVNIVQSRKYFVRRLIRATRTSSTDGGLGAMLFYKIGGGPQYIFYQGQRPQFTNEYASITANNNHTSLYIYTVQDWNSPTQGTYTVEIDNVLVTDLTAMGELPQSLKQFFTPSGITKWEELATSNNITAYDGTVKSGNDWLNELIPYVDSVATVGGYWDASSKQFVTSTQKFEIKRNLIDFGKEFVTSTDTGSGIWHDSRTLEAYQGMPYGTNGYKIAFNTIPVLKEKTYKYKLKGIHVNGYLNNQQVCYYLNWGVGYKEQIKHPRNEEVKSYTNTDSFYGTVYLDFYQTHGIVKQVKLWLDGYEEPINNDKYTYTISQPMFGYANVFDRLTSKGLAKFWGYTETTTNSSGHIGINTSFAIVVNKNNGEVQTTTTGSVSWTNTPVVVIYLLSSPQFISMPPFVMNKLDVGTWYVVNPQFGASAIKGLRVYATF